jgi:membrane peptidoglycan carboxypeptidase
MRKLKQYLFHKEPVTRQLIRYSFLVPALFFIFAILPVKKKINTSEKYSTTILASTGETMAYMPLGEDDHDNIPVIQMDDATVKVLSFLIAREDPKLLQQNSLIGFPENFRGISARNFNPFSNGGGSTISQQFLKWLANMKMVLNHRQRTIYSKLGEMAGAYKLTGIFTANEILQLYINEVAFLKGTVNGVQLNAVKFFDVNSIQELNLAEQYLLARSVKGINSAGIDFAALSKISRDSINALISISFRSMLIKTNKATEEDLTALLGMPIRFRKKPFELHNKPYLFDIIKPIGDSLKIVGNQYVTTLQPRMVIVADQALESYASTHQKILQIGSNILDVNVAIIDTRSGELVGTNSKPLHSPGGNMRMENHIFIRKPAASTIKPLLIAEGVEAGFLNETTIMIDQYRGRIHNYSPKYYGNVYPAFVIKKSLNTAIDNSPYRNAMQDGLERDLTAIYGSEISQMPDNYNRSQYCLGEPRELNIIQLAQLYRAMISDGNVIRSRITKTIISTLEYPFDTTFNWKSPVNKIFSQSTCQTMRKILKCPLEEGGTLHSIATMIKTTDDVLGKTGTSDSYKYGWTILISQPYLIVVSMSYWNIRRTNGASSIAVPTHSGAGSSGPIALKILNTLKK